MGTHPIFESDFDCLTEKMARGQKKNTGFSEKELELLRNFSPNTSSKGMAVFWIHALYVVIVPIWIQARVHQYPVGEQMIYLVLGTLLQAFALQFAYKNVKNVQKEKIALQRTEAVAAEVTAQVGTMSPDRNSKTEFSGERAKSLRMSPFTSRSCTTIASTLDSTYCFPSFSSRTGHL